MRSSIAVLSVFGSALLSVSVACSSSANSVPKNVAVDANVKSSATKAEATPEVKSLAVTIADGRDENEPPKPSEVDTAFVEKEFKATEAAIYKSSTFKCDDGDGGLQLLGTASGAFTKAGSTQKAYLYELCRAGRSFGIGGLIIADGDTIAAHYTFGENGLYTSVGSSADIDRNGLSEIILAGSGSGQGYTEASVSLYEFEGGTLKFIGSTPTYSDNSGAEMNESKILTTAYKVTAETGTAPVFMRDTFEKKGAAKTWAESKKREKITLEKKDAAKFVKIS